MRGALRDLRTGPRSIGDIERTTWTIRTLHPPRRVVAEGARPPFTLDGLVDVSLPRLGGLGEQPHAGA